VVAGREVGGPMIVAVASREDGQNYSPTDADLAIIGKAIGADLS
jgi:hypothetical protein